MKTYVSGERSERLDTPPCQPGSRRALVGPPDRISLVEDAEVAHRSTPGVVRNEEVVGYGSQHSEDGRLTDGDER